MKRTSGLPLVHSLVASLLLQAATCVAQEGNFDPSFGDGGRLLVDVSTLSTDDQATQLILRPHNKLLMGGSCVYTDPELGDGYTFCVTQLLADGSYDTSFGPGGVGYLQFNRFPGFPRDSSPNDMIVLSDGRIVLLGNTSDAVLIAVLLADGSALDTTVAGKGWMTLQFGGVASQATSIVQQPDGKILVAGIATGVNGNVDFAVGRLLADLSGFDTTFGSGGSQTVAFDLGGPTGDNTDECLAVRLQSSGKVVLAGISLTSPAQSTTPEIVISLARLNSDGTRDLSFGPDGDGRLHYAAGGAIAALHDAQIDYADRIVIAGAVASSPTPTTNEWLIDRLAPDGGRDPTFNNGNPQTFYQAPGNGGWATHLALTNDGIFAVGLTPRALAGQTNYFAVARLNANGSLDTRFGGGGKSYGSFTATRDVDTTGTGIAVGNGGVMVAGTQTQSVINEDGNTFNFAIGRLQYDQVFSDGFE